MPKFSVIVINVLQLCSVLGSTVTVFPENAADSNDYFVSPGQNKHEHRIVGGRETTIEKHPYQVALLVNKKTICGGGIISPFFILTAAHCVRRARPATVRARIGSTYSKNGTLVPIAKIWRHPGFRYRDKDVAVMKTARPMVYSSKVQAIALPVIYRPILAGSKVMASGWGVTGATSSDMPDKLREVEMSVVSQRLCYLAYPGRYTKNMFCAGDYYYGGESTCQGDSGGVVVQDKQAVGIVSFGRSCGHPFSPAVFTNVAARTIRLFILSRTGL